MSAIFYPNRKYLPFPSQPEEKLLLIDRHQSICNLPHQSEPPSIWCTGFTNEQTLQAGVFFLPLPPWPIFSTLCPLPRKIFPHPNPLHSVAKSKMAAEYKNVHSYVQNTPALQAMFNTTMSLAKFSSSFFFLLPSHISPT